MADLKSIRLSLQEALEDDDTKRGSASRLAMIIGIITLAVALVFSLAVMVFMGKDLHTEVKHLIYMVGGGHGAYLTGKVTSMFNRGGGNAPPKAEGGTQ